MPDPSLRIDKTLNHTPLHIFLSHENGQCSVFVAHIIPLCRDFRLSIPQVTQAKAVRNPEKVLTSIPVSENFKSMIFANYNIRTSKEASKPIASVRVHEYKRPYFNAMMRDCCCSLGSMLERSTGRIYLVSAFF
jgi:hypothetical protein